ncbi:4-hydroxy-tetrahydrodipicolinate reductase [Sphingomonas sp. AP4-R1]|uniref:4-hydroxy-tetrahydrodipicolinate reductase n=1 Tax=Sphingomonas sp. AP4-R1 TaxID=2735134 RepID=UPI001493B043|nr:4-hydroxy-tetrahydrodipicolinate reductase [Sphingomonas sp. AP4-R1]QJU57256.1 4-hydroxy-tetrahydrodipicolinate reductase [Sphingomonas sp. AP4-R1]
MTISIGILGAAGRMGRAIAAAAEEAGVTVAGGLDREGVVSGGPADAQALAAAADVLIDFSLPEALEGNLALAVETGTPLLIGTTGLQPEHHAAIDRAAEHVAILQTANTSLGVNVLRGLVEQAARILGADWDIEIVEMHHRHKLDSPSGTALLLGASANVGRGAASTTDLNRFDRMQEGAHAREEGGIYYASLRGGSVAGDHQVIFAAEGERIELGHRAENRGIFAKGALRGAQWLAGKPAGRYAMADALGFR